MQDTGGCIRNTAGSTYIQILKQENQFSSEAGVPISSLLKWEVISSALPKVPLCHLI